MPDIVKDINNARYHRQINVGMFGSDVVRVKRRLVALGYLQSAKKVTFGNQTESAVKEFQRDRGLSSDGIVGKLTWAALFDEQEQAPTSSASDYSDLDRFGAEIKKELIADLDSVSDIRRTICLNTLQFAVNPYNPPKYPLSFYIRGGNLYDKKTGALNEMTAKKLTSYFSNDGYSAYFDGGRKEMMLEAADDADYKIPGADCSGGIVGLWIHNEIMSLGFDANANTLYGRYCTKTNDPQPGDLAWKDGHIGMYVGAGRIVEWAGGAYGCQLTKMDDRRCYNFVDKKLHRMSAWEAYGKPKKY